MSAHFTLSDGTRLAFDVRGQGTPLLCLPGLTRNMADFDYVLPHLNAQVIRMDYRGRGASDWTGPATYTVLQEAQDVLALLDHLGLPQVAILGTSRGGLIAMLLAHIAKARLTGVVLNDIGPTIDWAGLVRIAGYIGKPPAARTVADHAVHLENTTPGFRGVPASRWLAEASRQVRVTGDGLICAYDPALANGFDPATVTPPDNLWPLFDALSGLPLAALRGAGSDLMSAATLAEMQRRRPDMFVATVPDRGHVPFLDEPESLTTLHAFLKALS
jgi:pimeloyl-ACP methyl ester carboxylesterase